MGARILSVEDNPDNMDLVTWILEDEGYTVVPAWTAEEGLSLLDKDDDIDLILMDICLPGISGIEATRKIRSNPARCNLPILAVTAHAVDEERGRIANCGVNEIITKPIDESSLVKAVRQQLDN